MSAAILCPAGGIELLNRVGHCSALERSPVISWWPRKAPTDNGNGSYGLTRLFIWRRQGCLCGYLTDPRSECHCTPRQIQNYTSRISRPLPDRIDIQLEVPAIQYQELRSPLEGEPLAIIRERVIRAGRESRYSVGRSARRPASSYTRGRWELRGEGVEIGCAPVRRRERWRLREDGRRRFGCEAWRLRSAA
jgi:hypothetical protein